MRRGLIDKRGLLTDLIIFLVFYLTFLSIMFIFIFRQGSGAVVLEQSYAKNIALLIDASRPVTEMKLNMEDAFKLAEKNGVKREEIVSIDGNIVNVKLSEKSGYKYSFFNDVDVSIYPDIFPEQNYIIKINGYKNDAE